ncbi:hypothetical protein LCGC14_0423380 [marine sediment metagenome]|uniref:Uncharacterized protein n=1 Tax=marine sediment metagenome TaxID=412755 RepID=A0A0F9SQ69_9ZZZZ
MASNGIQYVGGGGATVDGITVVSGGDITITPPANTVIASGILAINDLGHGSMTTGIVINHRTATNLVFALKSDLVDHGLSTATFGGNDAETDDFMSFEMASPTGGGLTLKVLGTAAAGPVPFSVQVYGGVAQTTDTPSSLGLIHLFAAEHDGSNNLSNANTNDNLFCIQSWSGGAAVTRLILKGDDGELHLGVATTVGLDAEDDVALVRTMQKETAIRGIVLDKYDRLMSPIYANYESLKRIGVVGEKDEKGQFLFRVQPRFALNEGAIWQLHTRLEDTRKELGAMKLILEERNARP